ncbi:DUF7537 family lipoprotein [Halomarina rubra]|uniref:Lipoprotein n=1 Tax=Halomarina rubra TaxID=2071873 RepID=A0ABD6AU49_9EURY|nr:hypothetical protein [Halomarina rubra]
MRRALPLVLAALVCLAGCGGFTGSDPATDAANPTPAAVPTDGPADDLPGLSASGITNATALAAVNADALANTSFTLRGNTTVVAANGTELVDGSGVTRVSANHSRSTARASGGGLYTRPVDHPVTRTERWYNGTATLVRAVGPNETTYLVPPFAGRPERIPGAMESYYRPERATSATVSASEGTVTLRIDVRPPASANATFVDVPVSVTEQTVTVRMTDEGRVRGYRIDYVGHLATDPDVRVEATSRTRFTDVGETTVERPEWVSTARNGTVVTPG